MKKLKEGKLGRKWFWCAIIVIWALMAVVFLVGTTPGKAISNGRLCIIMVLFVFYMAAIVMRLRDTGYSLALLIIFFIFPAFLFVIGCLKSKETDNVEQESALPDVLLEWMDNERR